MFQKMIKRISKRKDAGGSPFIKTVKIYRSEAQVIDVKMILDTGCEAYNLITYQVVDNMHKAEEINGSAELICICLNGETLASMGTINLRWKGRGFRKIFETTFHVIGGDNMSWQVILGAETIKRECILKFMGFGGRTILPKKTKDERAREDQRRREHDEEVARNAAEVAANENAKGSSASWSNWEWDESRQSYYRARLIGNAWEYQYSTNPT
ncbi:uncharacterized protein K444DRAFT_659903 [Hyaloscypha bicolor E]|uniref:Uncharacterized protein n=1 Tax=Hyaloscypha bicolor E TaxID=1095630 RepID=A0A2J6TNN0_9HELO|nr:uncharacterized protein K444DRAFT_659903 [Hyaloscypha bicolor E]PMD64633.1 hypothetical protein K444DRAFT_659903 [Hyaloscypha bicolor E]